MSPKNGSMSSDAAVPLRWYSWRRWYERFVKIRGTPREIAMGFALGVFVGMSPTMGFQTAIAVFVAALFKWNKISAAIGVWISNPVTAPILYGVTYFAGARILGGNGYLHPPDLLGVTVFLRILERAPEIFWAMTVGGILLGAPLALAAYTFAFSAVSRYQEGIRRKLAERRLRLATKKKGSKRRKTGGKPF
jgi:uncharacterized protein (DUF2062 family)